jgi:hypothetical protein
MADRPEFSHTGENFENFESFRKNFEVIPPISARLYARVVAKIEDREWAICPL